MKFCTEQALNGNFLVLFGFIFGFVPFLSDRRERHIVLTAFLPGAPTSESSLAGVRVCFTIVVKFSSYRLNTSCRARAPGSFSPVSPYNSPKEAGTATVQLEKLRSLTLQDPRAGVANSFWRGFCLCFLALISVCIPHIFFFF